MPAAKVRDGKIELMELALFEAYRFISQPSSGNSYRLEYQVASVEYNRLLAAMRAAMKANNIPF